MVDDWPMIIDGRDVFTPIDGMFERHHPGSGTLVGRFSEGSVDHVDQAVEAARRALGGGWGDATGAERGAMLHALAERLRSRAETYADLEADQVGIPRGHVGWLTQYCADVVDFYAGAARMRFGRTSELSSSRLGMTLEQPVGVVGIITPWNFPLVLTIWKVAAALAAGCTMVVKPDQLTPMTVIELARDLAEAGVPPGVVNVVTGPGPVLGDAMVTHRGVDKIAFTGSTATGRTIMSRASGTLKRLSLELGGKSPLIVLPDADTDAVVGAALECFFNAGQQCNVPSRLVLVGEQDGVLGELVDRARAYEPSADPDAAIGPLVNLSQYERVTGFVDEARKSGAQILVGDSRPDLPAPFMAPTIVSDVEPDHRIVREEVFGPVMVVQRAGNVDEAIRLANDGDYGLAAGIFTDSLDAATAAARRLEAGMVWINTWNSTVPELPTGGVGASGQGRELGLEGLAAYLETKTVMIDRVRP